MSNNEFKKRVLEATKDFYISRLGGKKRLEKKKNNQAKVNIFSESLFLSRESGKTTD